MSVLSACFNPQMKVKGICHVSESTDKSVNLLYSQNLSRIHLQGQDFMPIFVYFHLETCTTRYQFIFPSKLLHLGRFLFFIFSKGHSRLQTTVAMVVVLRVGTGCLHLFHFIAIYHTFDSLIPTISTPPMNGLFPLLIEVYSILSQFHSHLTCFYSAMKLPCSFVIPFVHFFLQETLPGSITSAV